VNAIDSQTNIARRRYTRALSRIFGIARASAALAGIPATAATSEEGEVSGQAASLASSVETDGRMGAVFGEARHELEWR
jgi:hypothetical protein